MCEHVYALRQHLFVCVWRLAAAVQLLCAHNRQRGGSQHLLCCVLCAMFCCVLVCHTQEEFFLRFAEFEEIVKEHERARAIYKYALDQLPRGAAQQLYARFVAFEKQHGSRWVV